MTLQKRQVLEKILARIKETETNSFNYIIPGTLGKKVRTYMSMREDILFCKKAVKELMLLKMGTTPTKQTIETALWTSIIVTYGKCFTDATQASKSKLEPKDCFSTNDEEIKEMHEQIMTLRHTFIAHRGDTENEQAVVYMKIPKNGEAENRTEYKVKSLRATGHNLEKLKKYFKLFNHVQKIIEQKFFRQAEKTHDTILNNMTAEQINQLLIL